VPRGKRHRIARAPLPLTYRGSKWPSQAGSSPGLRLQYGFARDRDNAHIALLRSHRYLIGPSTRLSCYMATETVFSFRRSLPICKGIDAILDLVLKCWGNGELTAGLIPAHSALSKAGRVILADET